jgi:uncharacterized protein
VSASNGNGSNPHRITTVEELRKLFPEPSVRTKSKTLDHLDAQAIEFLAESPFLLLATANREGIIEVSPKGDAPGFVKVENERTVAIPDRTGNNLIFGLQNILEQPQVGVIALRPATGETLRFSGTAEVTTEPALLQELSTRGKPALLAIRVHVTRSYFHCAKAMIRSGLWNPETWGATRSVSFGRIMAEQLGLAPETIGQIDGVIADNYRNKL